MLGVIGPTTPGQLGRDEAVAVCDVQSPSHDRLVMTGLSWPGR